MKSPHRSDRHTILKVLVGSHAHGLAGPQSDRDFRSVFVFPTVEMFRLGFKPPTVSWRQEEEGDEAAWEIAPYLSLALQSHPLILETFLAPPLFADAWGEELRRLFPAVWSPQKAYDAFTGYAQNQRTKFLGKKDGRPAKYAASYIRVLANLRDLLATGTFPVRIRESSLGDTIARFKDGQYGIGEVIELGEDLTEQARHSLETCRHHNAPERIEEFLIRLRKAFLF